MFPPEGDLGEILIDDATLQARVREIGASIGRDLRGEVPLLIAILKGSVVFVADLMRAIEGPVEIDFMAVSSYGNNTKSSGIVKIVKDLDQSVSGRHVILVEDIIDSGLTMQFLLDHISAPVTGFGADVFVAGARRPAGRRRSRRLHGVRCSW
ncbi:MAG: phosphoribosyltransferase family protein [Acidimicrobiales bacterium]